MARHILKDWERDSLSEWLDVAVAAAEKKSSALRLENPTIAQCILRDCESNSFGDWSDVIAAANEEGYSLSQGNPPLEDGHCRYQFKDGSAIVANAFCWDFGVHASRLNEARQRYESQGWNGCDVGFVMIGGSFEFSYEYAFPKMYKKFRSIHAMCAV